MPSDRIPADVLDRMIAKHRAAGGTIIVGGTRFPENDLDDALAAAEAAPPHPWARKRGDEIVDHINPKETPWL